MSERISARFVVRQTFNGRRAYLSEAHYDLFIFRAETPETALRFTSASEACRIAEKAARIYPLCKFAVVQTT